VTRDVVALCSFLASLVALFGEYDISGELETKRSVTKNVKRVIVHRQYDAATFENDLALLELESPIHYDAHIGKDRFAKIKDFITDDISHFAVPICMPPDDKDFTARRATVTGWGRLKYGGGVPSILQEVEVSESRFSKFALFDDENFPFQVPVIENSVCQEMFQTAGHTKKILPSFLCAGYANGQKDSCEVSPSKFARLNKSSRNRIINVSGMEHDFRHQDFVQKFTRTLSQQLYCCCHCCAPSSE
jgi:Trypsin